MVFLGKTSLGLLEHEEAEQKGQEGTGTGQEQPPHVRSYLFEYDRLPRTETINAGLAEIYIIFENPFNGNGGAEFSLTPNRQLPQEILTIFREKMLLVRATDEYRESSVEEKTDIRIKAVQKFIDDLMGENAEFERELEAFGIPPKEFSEKIKKLMRAYKGQEAYLIWTRKMNQETKP